MIEVQVNIKCPCGRRHQRKFGDATPAGGQHKSLIAKTVKEVAAETGVPKRAILGPSRSHRIAAARGIVMALLHDAGLTFKESAQAVNCKSWLTAKNAYVKWAENNKGR